ncbi:bifunctional aspartate kinase/homoserine dehydrogenase I [Elizabethkingia argentiflava]|uniref:Bifunctional aspartate kinase/homoserine dehydrogenase I n=1 Tax=Elizabethkingia argenteiflava TaxID=2681556 RepID=A0A845PNZ8_9FLAO|nr:bifunctional aspartate kinase/homoserine dehydrogenase I [Elizabethkingia argenteiflava]NAW50069.1 bifunctional aspartate kinase/homoserine dehydrogenase I [Elizabethkingia argenteiflava]
MKVLKFGGKSLANGQGLEKALEIIRYKKLNQEDICIVVSARGNTTDTLMALLENAKNGQWEEEDWINFKEDQLKPISQYQSVLEDEFKTLKNFFSGVKLLKDYSLKIKDEILSFGEILSAKTLVHLLNHQSLPAKFVDARTFLITDNRFGNAIPKEEISERFAQKIFQEFRQREIIPVVTGFIGATENGETTTLGRNGSNYSAALVAKFIDAEILENYTHVDGVFSVNPEWVEDARHIKNLSFQEANEMVNFGMNILHDKTILPLIDKNIPLKILNTFKGFDQTGTLISNDQTNTSVKSLMLQQDKSLVVFEGRGLLGKVGVDARFFGALSRAGVSVGVISQGSSERGMGVVVDQSDALKAVEVLRKEFARDYDTKDVQAIHSVDNLSVISIIGQKMSHFNQSYNALIKNQVEPLLISNTVSGANVSIVIRKEDTSKALNIIHGELFENPKQIHLAIFGCGTVGKTLINQILHSTYDIVNRKNTHIKIFGISNSRKMILDKKGIGKNWEHQLQNASKAADIGELVKYAKENHLENLIAVDNTVSHTFVDHYEFFAENGFDLVSSNKIFNTLPIHQYRNLRKVLHENNKKYLYETNVGAGLPLIDTIKLLHLSGENITRIKGVFSGSLSYIFNHFSIREVSFSNILREARDKGYTEPDPREDLSGNDVARKLLILARELDLVNEFSDIHIQNLIPESLQHVAKDDFISRLEELNDKYVQLKQSLPPDHVLRYVGELKGDLQKEKGDLEVKLISVPRTASLGQVKGSDSIFEIYTESYGENPLVIMGAGAGAEVTARGVFGDILRVSEHK